MTAGNSKSSFVTLAMIVFVDGLLSSAVKRWWINSVLALVTQKQEP